MFDSHVLSQIEEKPDQYSFELSPDKHTPPPNTNRTQIPKVTKEFHASTYTHKSYFEPQENKSPTITNMILNQKPKKKNISIPLSLPIVDLKYNLDSEIIETESDTERNINHSKKSDHNNNSPN